MRWTDLDWLLVYKLFGITVYTDKFKRVKTVI
jgi:hypothetical protein